MHSLNIQRRFFNTRLLTLLASSGFAVNAAAKTSSKAAVKTDDADKVLLAKSAPAGVDPAGYLVSEKLDGVRALWDGKVLRFRSGRSIAAPDWFTAKLPDVPLDGELWISRGQFEALSGAVRKATPVDSEWFQVNYMVFELPQDTSAKSTFEQRAVKLKSVVQDAAFPQLQAVEQFKIANRATLQAKLNDIVQEGGEGLMLHLAKAPIVSGRSDVLLKLKLVQDAEAVVIGYVRGKGKYAGMTGALEVETDKGQRFKLGTGLSDELRKNPPEIGSKVTYAYRDLTSSGIPRFASFVRVHDDL
jgi:DNA ligase 1